MPISMGLSAAMDGELQMHLATRPLGRIPASTPLSGDISKTPSLEGLNASVALPAPNAGFWRQLRAFAGPAFLVSVGYMDPGNWATDLQGGATYRYGLLWVVALASFMA